MSHELRTPFRFVSIESESSELTLMFSSFYGLLDLLSGTELNPGQSEIVQTAKQSCEQLLKVIQFSSCSSTVFIPSTDHRFYLRL